MTIRHFPYAINIFFLALIFSISLLAQNSGKILGKVVDANTGEPLVGVNVVVVGTEMGSATNEEGEFIITPLAPGMYNVEFSYIGYARYVATDVMVTNNKPVQLNVKLTPVSLETEAVEVTA
ncbi:MAG: carboxypeptidase-like regulatory domain-containing protein, partial [Calditrichaeota bacterium]